MIKETTTATYYSVIDMPKSVIFNHHETYPEKAMKKCDNCKQDNLEADYKYCPNCGKKFENY